MKVSMLLVVGVALISPHAAHAQQITAHRERVSNPTAQQNVPPAVQQAEADVEAAVRRFRVGLQGGVGLDPELLDVGAHAAFGPLFTPNVEVRPGVEIGVGEVTTLLALNFDLLYTVPGFTRETRWIPYVGAGPTFGLSHRGFATDDLDHIDSGASVVDINDDDERGRFDFSDTDFNGGLNLIVGMRKPTGMFFEMKTTAWGVSNIRLIAGFNF